LSRFVHDPGLKREIFPFETPARNHPLVQGGITNRDKRHPFCHGSLHDPGLKVCLYIKAATLPLQHLATFSSLIRRHRRRRVLLLRRCCHPSRPPPSEAPPSSAPRDSPPPPASRNPPTPLPRARPPVRRRRPPERCFLPDLPRPLGLPDPHTPRVGLLPILLLRVVLPGLRGSAAAAARRVPCCPAILSIVASSCW
jgi:hypothetical protein